MIKKKEERGIWSNDKRKYDVHVFLAVPLASTRSRHYSSSLSLPLPPTHSRSPESQCHFMAQTLSSLCCTLTLSHISSYRSVPPHHTAGWLIIHFIIPPTTRMHAGWHTHIHTEKHTTQGGEQTCWHLCRYTAPRLTQTQTPDFFFLFYLKLPQTYPPCTANANQQAFLPRHVWIKLNMQVSWY